MSLQMLSVFVTWIKWKLSKSNGFTLLFVVQKCFVVSSFTLLTLSVNTQDLQHRKKTFNFITFIFKPDRSFSTLNHRHFQVENTSTFIRANVTAQRYITVTYTWMITNAPIYAFRQYAFCNEHGWMHLALGSLTKTFSLFHLSWDKSSWTTISVVPAHL